MCLVTWWAQVLGRVRDLLHPEAGAPVSVPLDKRPDFPVRHTRSRADLNRYMHQVAAAAAAAASAASGGAAHVSGPHDTAALGAQPAAPDETKHSDAEPAPSAAVPVSLCPLPGTAQATQPSSPSAHIGSSDGPSNAAPLRDSSTTMQSAAPPAQAHTAAPETSIARAWCRAWCRVWCRALFALSTHATDAAWHGAHACAQPMHAVPVKYASMLHTRRLEGLGIRLLRPCFRRAADLRFVVAFPNVKRTCNAFSLNVRPWLIGPARQWVRHR